MNRRSLVSLGLFFFHFTCEWEWTIELIHIDQCTQPVQSGSCKGEYNRYYYDTASGQCQTFIYGGCQKNQNHFLTLKDCLKTCVVPRERGRTGDLRVLILIIWMMSFDWIDICLLPKVVGTCQERRPTWYFDMIEQECKMFYYSGTFFFSW